MNGERPGPSVEARILTVAGDTASPRFDTLVTEEPLEIRLRAGGASRTVAITMRTPGNDFELAAGFLHNEGVLANYDALRGISFCIDRDVDPEQRYNIVNVDLAAHELPELDTLERHFTTTSACGVCGKANLDALRMRGVEPVASDAQVDAATILALPDRLRAAQGLFARTGGLHAAALFDETGTLVNVREDVGRHNALDKLVGAMVEAGVDPRDGFCCITSRASVEMVRKAVAVGITALVAVSAPTSRAVATAREAGLALAGFARRDDLVLYANADRFR